MPRRVCSSHLSEPCFWGFTEWNPHSDAGQFGSCPDIQFFSMSGLFKLGHHVSVGTCRRLLGLMAAASPVLPLGLLHMRPFLWWMKELRLHPMIPATRLIRVSRSCSRPLLQWRDFLQSGVRIGAINRRHMITAHQRQTGERGMDRRVPFLAHKLPGTQGCLPGFDVFSPRSRGASYHSQNGQYGGSVPHKPPGGFTVVHPGQACAPSSPFVPGQVPFFEGSSRSGNAEPCVWFSVETETRSSLLGVAGLPLCNIWCYFGLQVRILL